MPSYDEEENCGVISTDAQGRWHNRDCSVALPYICKKRPNATLDPFTTGMCAVCVCVRTFLACGSHINVQSNVTAAYTYNLNFYILLDLFQR